MRRGFVAAVVLGILLVVGPSAGFASGPPTGAVSSMTVTASTHAAKAHAVRFTVTLRYEMQCNYAGAGPVVVTFPSSLRLPTRFAAGAVELSGKPIAATVAGQRVSVTIPRHQGTFCDVMGPGSLALTFTQAAKLANPSRAGSYSFKATHGKRTFVAKLTVKPAT
jgi:hypothetical protein